MEEGAILNREPYAFLRTACARRSASSPRQTASTRAGRSWFSRQRRWAPLYGEVHLRRVGDSERRGVLATANRLLALLCSQTCAVCLQPTGARVKDQVKELLNLIYIVLTLTGSERAEYLFRALGFWSISLVQLRAVEDGRSKTKADVQGVTTVRHISTHAPARHHLSLPSLTLSGDAPRSADRIDALHDPWRHLPYHHQYHVLDGARGAAHDGSAHATLGRSTMYNNASGAGLVDSNSNVTFAEDSSDEASESGDVVNKLQHKRQGSRGGGAGETNGGFLALPAPSKGEAEDRQGLHEQGVRAFKKYKESTLTAEQALAGGAPREVQGVD